MLPDLHIRSYRYNYTVNYNESPSSLFTRYSDCLFVVDSNVRSCYSELFDAVPNILLVAASEQTKTIDHASFLINNILHDFSHLLFRPIIVVGGGILQDIMTFVCGVIKRGLDWIFVPTTLLSMGDSCIGSKSSLNISGIKNQVGLFYPPSSIFVCPSFLGSLNRIDLLSGYGDISHYFHMTPEISLPLLESFTTSLLKSPDISSFDFLPLLSTAHHIKKPFIEADEFDLNERKLLNFGHSFAHSIEQATNFLIPHGVAVIYGCYLAYLLSYNQGLLPNSLVSSVSSIFLHQSQLIEICSDEYTDLPSLASIINGLKSDKKNLSPGSAALVLPTHAGPRLISYSYSDLLSSFGAPRGPFKDISFSKLFTL